MRFRGLFSWFFPAISAYARHAPRRSVPAVLPPSIDRRVRRSRRTRPVCSSRHHVTSVVSPNVQIIAMPDPLSGSARRCAEHRHAPRRTAA